VSLEKDCCLETYAEAYRLGKENENKRILGIIKDTYIEPYKEEYGSFVWTEDIVALIGKKQIIECFWCNEVYDSKDHASCPNCATDLNTKEIKIIPEEDTK